MKFRELIRILFMILGIILLTTSSLTIAQTTEEKTNTTDYKGLWIALTISLPAIAGGYAVAKTGTSAISALTEKPELFGNVIIIVALAEGIAIYGLLVAILLLFVG